MNVLAEPLHHEWAFLACNDRGVLAFGGQGPGTLAIWPPNLRAVPGKTLTQEGWRALPRTCVNTAGRKEGRGLF